MQDTINMQRAIITPTFRGHFKFIKNYLKSFDKYLIDRDFPICFIISKQEEQEFQQIILPYKEKLNLQIYFLEDILNKFGIEETPEELLVLYGRLSFQTIKKLYGALYIEPEQFLFLDSESMLIKPTNMNTLFEEYFKSPKFFVSRISNRRKTYNANFTYEFIRAITSLMGKEPEFYTTESYEWFYELRILKDSIKTLGEPIEVVRNYNMPDRYPNLEGILEALWYYQYLLYNNRYGYKILITDDELEKYLSKDIYKTFNLNFNKSNFWQCGVMEVFSIFINKDNVNCFIELFNDYNLSVARMEWPENMINIKYQNLFIEKTNINILASSQAHAINNNKSYYIKSSKYYGLLKNNSSIFLAPFKYFLKWICSLFNIFLYIIEIFIKGKNHD